MVCLSGHLSRLSCKLINDGLSWDGGGIKAGDEVISLKSRTYSTSLKGIICTAKTNGNV